MDEFLRDSLSPVVEQSATRSRELLRSIANQLTVEWATGIVNIADRGAVANALRDFRGPDSDLLAGRYLALLQDGFAVRRGFTNPEDPAFFTIPWRALFHAPTVESLTPANWQWLGIQPGVPIAQIRANLVDQFVRAPDYILDPAALAELQNLARPAPPPPAAPPAATAAQLRNAELALVSGVLPPGDPGTKPRDPTADLLDIALALLAYIQTIADCLIRSQKSLEWHYIIVFGVRVPVYPIGVRFCMDAACAEAMESALWKIAGMGAGQLWKMVPALIAAGVISWASIAAAFAALGPFGWVGLALLHFGIHWWVAIHAARSQPGANGVCIIHFWPWNSAVTGGLINGWAEPRP